MITIPDRLKTKLEKNPALCGAVYSSLSKLNPWFSDNKTVFFPEYTDHGITHLQEVINTADSLITDESWPSITANDAAAIITSTLLHDCAMHLSEDGFYSLINKKYPLVNHDILKMTLTGVMLGMNFLQRQRDSMEKN